MWCAKRCFSLKAQKGVSDKPCNPLQSHDDRFRRKGRRQAREKGGFRTLVAQIPVALVDFGQELNLPEVFGEGAGRDATEVADELFDGGHYGRHRRCNERPDEEDREGDRLRHFWILQVCHGFGGCDGLDGDLMKGS